MKKLLLILGLSFGIYGQHANAYVTVAQYDLFPEDMQISYLGGVFLGVASTHQISIERGGEPVYCLPNNTALGYDLAKVAVSTFKTGGGDPTWNLT